MLRNIGVEEFTPEQKAYYNRLPVRNLDRLYSMGNVPGLVVQDGEIIEIEARTCRGKCLKMAVIAFLILFTLAGAVLIGSWQEDWIEQIREERSSYAGSEVIDGTILDLP